MCRRVKYHCRFKNSNSLLSGTEHPNQFFSVFALLQICRTTNTIVKNKSHGYTWVTSICSCKEWACSVWWNILKMCTADHSLLKRFHQINVENYNFLLIFLFIFVKKSNTTTFCNVSTDEKLGSYFVWPIKGIMMLMISQWARNWLWFLKSLNS